MQSGAGSVIADPHLQELDGASISGAALFLKRVLFPQSHAHGDPERRVRNHPRLDFRMAGGFAR